MERDATAERFWNAYLETLRDPIAASLRWYEVFRIGDGIVWPWTRDVTLAAATKFGFITRTTKGAIDE